jgi:hypothetical protein
MTIAFLLFLLDKNNGERKKKRENKNTCEYERELFQKRIRERIKTHVSMRERVSCFKSCQKVYV